MGKKVRNLTAQGQAVRGLLTGILAPRLAADAALKPGDIDKLLKGVALGKYTPQIPLIVADAKAKFGGHLVKDASLDDLPEILEALKAAGGDDDGDEGIAVDDDMGEDAGTPGEQLMAMLGKYQIPAEDLDKINGLLTAMAPAVPAVADKGKPPAFPAKPAGAALPKPTEVPQAMDAAKIRKETIQQMHALAKAAEEVAPFIGKVDLSAFDSAPALYKIALDQAKIPTEGVDPSAFRAMVGMLQKPDESKPTVAMDKAAVDSYAAAYPNRPGKA